MVYKYFDKKTESGVSVNETQRELKNYINQKLKKCVTDAFTKYVWVKLLSNKKGKTAFNAFIKIVNESNRKGNRLWDQARELYYKLIQEFQDINNGFKYLTHNEGNLVNAESFLKTLQAKHYIK